MSLRFDRVGKAFPGVQALDDVSFEAEAGKVHALLGENGAGKSTLLKILSGAYAATSGAILIDGQPMAFKSTHEALASGVAVIYQELHLIPQLSVAENIMLGHLPSRRGWVDQAELRRQAAQLLLQMGVSIDPGTRLGTLPIAARQMVEIAKSLSRNASVIAFDEPTSSLGAAETEQLFRVIDQLRQAGKTILYVSHRMDEIFRICDAATILRDGKWVETIPDLAQVSEAHIVHQMVGRDISVEAPQSAQIGEPALTVRSLTGPGLSEPFSLTAAKGEVVGLFGLVGAGRTEALSQIFGSVRPKGGSVEVDGRPLRLGKPKRALEAGMAFCPEDRKREGIIPLADICDNLSLGRRRGFWIQAQQERKFAEETVQKFRIRTPSIDQRISLLSGGSQQKVILGRVLGHQPRVLLLDEPTRGIDVGAKAEIYAIIRSLAQDGIAIVAASGEIPELLTICDRIVVMEGGRLKGSLARAEATPERLLALALPS